LVQCKKGLWIASSALIQELAYSNNKTLSLQIRKTTPDIPGSKEPRLCFDGRRQKIIYASIENQVQTTRQ